MKYLFYIAFFVFGLLVITRLLEKTGIFFPTKSVHSTPRDTGLAFEDVFFKTEDGKNLNGWFIRNPEAVSTLLFFHGNAGNIADRLQKIKVFHLTGLNVFIFDYRGYGKSEGSPSEQGVYRDARAAWDYLNTRQDVNPKKIVLYGASLGGAVAIHLAKEKNVEAIIVDSSFPSARQMAKIMYPMVPTFFLGTKLDSASIVRQLPIPKLFLHSVEDELVPYALGQQLYEAAAGPKEFVSLSGGHNNGHMASKEQFEGSIRNFLSRLNLLP